MSTVTKGDAVPGQEKADNKASDVKGIVGEKSTTTESEITVKKERQLGPMSSSSSTEKDATVTKDVSSDGPTKLPSSANGNPSQATATDGAKTAATNPKQGIPRASTSTTVKPAVPTPVVAPAAAEPAAGGSTAPAVPKQNTNDSKPGSNSIHAKKEKSETPVPKPAITTSAVAMTAKQPQQYSHPKSHTPQQQHQQHRYFIPSRQNQEEAVFKMVQNIFKLLENRGPLTMAQLEYNLPILMFGPTPTAPTINSTSSSKSNPTGGDAKRDVRNMEENQKNDSKLPNTRKSLCEEKLIPGNMVPDIVELLVTLGLIQQQVDDEHPKSSEGATTQQTKTPKSQPRFAVHFGKPKQFLVTPTNVLSKIAKAQTEIQLSRQRQDILKEALGMGDKEAAERVKHIVLEHPQVVDDPVYVTALRNLQVDGMLMAGASGTANASSATTPSSSTSKDGAGKSKPGAGGSGKKVGGGKRRQSGGNGNGGSGAGNPAPAKRKRQRPKKEILVRSGDADSSISSGKKPNVPQGSISSIPTEQPKKAIAATSGAASNTSVTTPPVPAGGSASVTIPSKNL